MRFKYPDAGSVSRDFHIMKILCAIRDNPGISRSQLSDIEGISKPTTSRVVEGLLKEGMIIESGMVEESDAKRKPIGLRLNADRFCCVGVNISQSIMTAVITDFEANPLYEFHDLSPRLEKPEELYHLVEQAIRKVLAGAGRSEKDVLGAGVGLSGLINARDGTVINLSSQGFITDIPFTRVMETRFPFPFLLDNDVNTLILSEKVFSRNESSQNCLFINYWDGLGAAAIIGGTLLQGSTNAAGEIGHTIIQPGGRRCRCGNLGCAEVYCLPETICELVREGLQRGRKSLLSADDPIDIRQVLQAYEKGDSLCAEHIMDTASRLSICVASAMNILDPDTVIFSGEMFDYSRSFYQLVLEETKEKLLGGSRKPITFILRHPDSLNIRLGAVSLVFNAFFRRT